MGTKMSKKSVVTITVMACLLAVAVATTIVLAAFQAQKSVTTTIKFSNGVQIQVNGAYLYTAAVDQTPASSSADVVSKTANLVWGVKEGTATATFQKVPEISNVSDTVVLEAISFTNGNASQSTTAWFIAKPTITCTQGTSATPIDSEDLSKGYEPTAAQTAAATAALTDALPVSGWIAIGSGWYAYGAAGSGDTIDATFGSTAVNFTDVAVSTTINFLSSTQITSSSLDDLAGATYVASLEVFAVNAGAADAETVLAGIISGS